MSEIKIEVKREDEEESLVQIKFESQEDQVNDHIKIDSQHDQHAVDEALLREIYRQLWIFFHDRRAQFPLPFRPPCPECRQPGFLRQTQSHNKRGNGGRPYYECQNWFGGRCSRAASEEAFITFDDAIGIFECNPLCECGLVSRRTKSGSQSTYSGRWFYKCAVGCCEFWSWGGWPPEEGSMRSGLRRQDSGVVLGEDDGSDG